MGLDNDSITARFRELELQRRRIEAEITAVVAVADARGVYGDDGHRSIKGWMRANANWSGDDVTPDAARRGAVRDHALRSAMHCWPATSVVLRSPSWPGPAITPAAVTNSSMCSTCCSTTPSTCRSRISAPSCDAGSTLPTKTACSPMPRRIRPTARHRCCTRSTVVVDVRASGGRPLDTAMMLGIFEQFVEAEFHIDVAARTELHGPDAPASLLPRTDAQRRFDALMKIFETAASMPADARAPVPSSISCATSRRSRPCSPVTG